MDKNGKALVGLKSGQIMVETALQYQLRQIQFLLILAATRQFAYCADGANP